MIFKNKQTIVEEDIEWYCLFSYADCGIRSNWNAMVSAKMYGTRSLFEDPYNDAIFAAVHRRNLIESRLKTMTPRYVDILYTAFANCNIPPVITKYYHRYASAAVHSKLISKKELLKICNAFYQHKSSTKEKLLLQEISIQAAKDYTSAINQYMEARKKR